MLETSIFLLFQYLWLPVIETLPLFFKWTLKNRNILELNSILQVLTWMVLHPYTEMELLGKQMILALSRVYISCPI
jgi:hypothetical protein